ncbi:UDP-N-acetylmuramoyl-tripeptide--D-alanyl-D-alanine ligase [Dokdonella koreensis]|uniref:UDP-N-acetylmuramoyl-tripeptide--D-alanyl-D-alanine ligase n=1 Tax=Dokdonella koreensis DS-123 TaxID=1300342 RepID=A0A167GI75_9GAMM|nr:UDP-N-acetylmuramoyl-tripeptide--D-alanyl-D-alanine ligase [Dokdonella koreensis]ANB16587.1 UDP-N-acetylmuramoyl-tripeptide-D-alanyl-D-alanine ligase [Dokdonella koreensis DS-123]
MLTQSLQRIAAATHGTLVGADRTVGAVATDSRRAQAGALFVALRGERFDAHDFVAQAAANGAVAALVERPLAIDLPQVLVADTERALGDLARAARLASRARVVGITGSNGKTTVKTLVAAILERHGRTHVNAGNLNNEIGLPLSVLAMPDDVEYAVFEMGAGKPGDIAYLVDIARPDIAVVNNVAPAHLERLGSLRGVAETKGAIYAGLPADGTAVINADDAFAGYFAGLAGTRRILRYGLDLSAEVNAQRIGSGRFELCTPAGTVEVALPLPGRHNVLNALAASALALALAVPLETIRAGLEAAPPVQGRLLRHRLADGAVLIDDSYNANPGSFAAAIAILAAEHGETVLVMGDMGELGTDSEALHAQTGTLARRSGIGRLHAVGPRSAAAVQAFGPGAMHHADQATLIAALRGLLRHDTVLLVKGSRSSAMDRVVRALLDDESGSEGAKAEETRHVA